MMNYFRRSSRYLKIFALVVFLIGLTTLESVLGATQIHAQSSEDWSVPTNLSQSGSSSEPIMVIDAEGIFHVIWSDEFAGYKYVSGNGVEWSEPAIVSLPFTGGVPELLADEEGFIHAFWLDASNGLYYSSVRAIDFEFSAAWPTPVKLGESALDIGISLDHNGDIHLIYLRPLESTEFPAGVYYRKLTTGEGEWSWSAPTLIYSSPYFRSVEVADSNVDIATSAIDDAEYVYAVWDNRQRGRVYLGLSKDGGQTWGTPEEIDRPDSALGYSNTSKILVDAYERDVLLVWQRSSNGGFCSEYYQQSGDGGNTWSQPEEIIRGAQSCGQDEQLINDGQGMIYLWTDLQNQISLTAWDRQQWSKPQVQNELSAFTDTETQKTVTYDCRRPALEVNNRLAVVGCDTGVGGDIWFTDRSMDDVPSWFSSQSAWSKAEEFVSGQIAIDSLVLIPAPSGNLMAVWGQKDQDISNQGQSAIYAASWDGESWTESVPIIQASQGSLTQPDATIDNEGRVMVVWSSSEDGKIYFDWTNIASAQNPAEWADPVALPISQSFAQAPEILVSKSGVIYVVYAITVNEGRGVYLTRSEDGGENWSPPVQIFDGVAANWQMVDSPQLVETQDGVLHALWSPRSILDNSGYLGLYYARSEDNGNTWSKFQDVTDGDVMWSQMGSSAEGSLFRIWQEGNQQQPVIKYQFSQDSGLNWSPEESLGSFGERSLMARIVSTPNGNLHMLQIVRDSSGELIQRHWLWENERWSINEYFDLTNGLTEEAFWMESTLSANGDLATIFSAKADTQPGLADRSSILFTNRPWEEVVVGPDQLPTPTSMIPVVKTTAPAENLPVKTPVVENTPTPDLNALTSLEAPTASSSSFMGVGRGVILSVLIIGVVVGLGVWKVRSGR